MAIPDYRLPEGLERGASGGPDFKTVIQESVSGREQRVGTWTKCRARYDIAYALMSSADPVGDYKKVETLFYGHNAKIFPFRFRAPNDSTAINESFGPGDGVTTQFQLKKTYDPGFVFLGVSGLYTYVREIVLPVASTLAIKVSGVPTSAYTLGAGGIVTFTAAPSNAAPLLWSGLFDIPVRFDVDHLPVVFDQPDMVKIGSIQIREVLNEF